MAEARHFKFCVVQPKDHAREGLPRVNGRTYGWINTKLHISSRCRCRIIVMDMKKAWTICKLKMHRLKSITVYCCQKRAQIFMRSVAGLYRVTQMDCDQLQQTRWCS